MQLKKKQTSLLIITIVAILILVWQIYQLISSDIFTNENDGVATAAPQTLVEAAKPSPEAPTVKEDIPAETAQSQQNLISNQKVYLELTNNYEIAKMKRRLLQEELAIANTQYEIGVLNHKYKTLDQPENHASSADSALNKTKEDLRLVYLDYQNGSWSATLASGNQFQQVNVGAQLTDGSYVMAINNRGVIMQHGNFRYNLNFNGATPLNSIPRAEVVKIINRVNTPAPESKPDTLNILQSSVKTEPEVATPTPLLTASPKSLQSNEPANDRACAHDKCQAVKMQFSDLSNTAKFQVASDTVKDFYAASSTIKNTQTPDSMQKTMLTTKPVKDNTSLSHTNLHTENSGVHERDPKHSLDENVLLELPAYSYTIKLRESSNQDELLAFAKKNHIDDRTLCYANSRHKQPYYTLVYGDYLTTRAAESALNDLPSELRNEHIAIRVLSQIQQEITR